MRPQQKIILGAGLAALAGAFIAATPVLGWSSISRTWAFVSGLLIGMIAGIGVMLAVHGLIESRREQSRQP